MSIINYPISHEAMLELSRDHGFKCIVKFTPEPGIFEMSEKDWRKLPLELRPCTWCGELMRDEVDSNSKDICLDCASKGVHNGLD